jgi:hypothetical protein
VWFGALDRKGREKLIRYFLRPAIATERLSILRDGSVAYKLRYTRPGGKTHRVMSALEAMGRIAALVPPPHSPLLRYHGVLAAGSPLLSRVVPLRDKPRAATSPSAADRKTNGKTNEDKMRKRPARAVPATVEPNPLLSVRPSSLQTPEGGRPGPRTWRPNTSTIPWQELMRRTLGIDPAQCTRCDCRLKPIAIITRQDVVQKILAHLSLPQQPAPIGPGGSMGYDITGEPIPSWVMGVDPEAPEQAGSWPRMVSLDGLSDGARLPVDLRVGE